MRMTMMMTMVNMKSKQNNARTVSHEHDQTVGSLMLLNDAKKN